ncbi:PilZ domain-containing protein [Sphingomicrobium aestuariivivum]|uniref:PilZ domain-containing protein n=1 Tax=Sphingomicrobium aestuariivivum TaxID=1582356 RepID=UPI001FD7191F|nr:PilZ domain-containing protein [Sphingomicrobium aestuariivivum]MCJ8190174.1 PilZ domain-containing protein [Sphingomicrobium aestuariivivum]
MSDQMMETTLYSLDEETPSADRLDQRDGERHLTLYRVGSVMLGDRRELCLIKNISAGGMMIRAYCRIAEGDALTVELKNGEPVSGKAIWTKGQNVGVQFDEKIDILSILSTSMEGPRPRMPRIEVSCPVSLYVDSHPIPAQVEDISQGGVKVAVRQPLPRGEKDLGVALPGMAPIRASVRWQSDESAGITFNTLMPLGDLVAWLERQRAPISKAS